MSQLVFAAPPLITVPVRGRSERVPIRRIFCVGRNYEAHAKEMGVAVDREAPFYSPRRPSTTCRQGRRCRIRPGRPTITTSWSSSW